MLSLQNKIRMTLDDEIQKLIKNHVKDFINKIHIKYDINKNDLQLIWDGGNSVLEKKSKQELVDMCKKLGLKSIGKKKDLIDLISQSNTKLQNDYQVVISKNKHGFYEHSDTKLVFNKVDKVVIGKQLETGEIAELTLADIDTCNKHNFEYSLPENLHEDDDCDSVVSAKEQDDSENEFSDFLEEDD